MADSRQLRRLVDYNQWADERILAAIDGLGVDELERPREAYFQTLAANIRHTLIAQRNWLARWHGQPRGDQTIGDSWRAAYATTHAALRSFVAGLSDADADRVVRFTDLRGTRGRSCWPMPSSTSSTTARRTGRRRGCSSSA